MERLENVELRHLPPGYLQGVAVTLEENDAWKRLMINVPENLNDIENSRPKYTTEHVKCIENASIKQKRLSAEILFEEWGTSGRVRPTLSHLVEVLKKSELHRAADIIAINLLKGSPVERPSKGPAALVDVSLTRLLNEKQIKRNTTENFLNNMQYPNSLSTAATIENNLDCNVKKYENRHEKNFKITTDSLMSKNNSVSTIETDIESMVSDMIKFSKSVDNSRSTYEREDNYELPALSILLNETKLNHSSRTEVSLDIDRANISSVEAVNLNVSNNTMESNSITNNSSEQTTNESCLDQNIPNFSLLNSHIGEANEKKESHSTITSNDSSSYLPVLSALNNEPSSVQSRTYGSTTDNNNSELTIERKFTNSVTLSNIFHSFTSLPHYQYSFLEQCTNRFDDRMYDKNNPSSGYKIGSGGSGTIYIARGVYDCPVAVKKLSTNGMGRYSPEILLQQFLTEIKLLSIYKHGNILPLLGYSGDGPNYCLIYEYLEGGSLEENIANPIDFDSTMRLKIALGTAKGIEYLHYGYEKSLIHRDIKSANILLTKVKIPKLCDFGLIKQVSNPTVTSNIIGTNAYMAPEAFRGDVSVKMDVFSFGVVMLELFTGLPPYDKTRIGTDIVTHILEICPDETIVPTVDSKAGNWDKAKEFFQLTRKCLKEEKSKRPVISDVIKELESIM